MTAQEALARWDAGETVWTLEMGGIGPGYEQCIHVLVFEIIRDNEPLPAPGDDFGRWGEAAISRIDAGCGFSGAQVSAARSLAYHFMRDGLDKTLAGVDSDRRILVSRHWPRIPDRPPSTPGDGGAET